MKTFQPKGKDIKREWHLIDAKGEVLGRIATQAAIFLMGKHKPTYAPHLDSGDFVVILNAKDVVVTGRKKEQKVYQSHSGYPGGFKEISFAKLSKEHPDRVIRFAVRGMLPDNRLKKDREARLKVANGGTNPFEEKFK